MIYDWLGYTIKNTTTEVAVLYYIFKPLYQAYF